jgi:curved DNA-binding protein CbpA
MEARRRMMTEIDALHELVDDLDYYGVLVLDKDCAPHEIGDAFRTESRRLHPDRMNALGNAEVQKRANDIYRLVNEAYRVLKDPEQRGQYDMLLADGVIRMTDDARSGASDQKRANDPMSAAKHQKAEKYWKMALSDWDNQSYRACVMNIQFALNFEPANEVFREWLDKAKKLRDESESKKEKNPYKLRIM